MSWPTEKQPLLADGATVLKEVKIKWNEMYPIPLDMLPLLTHHLRYGECEGQFSVCVARVPNPQKLSLREVGGPISGFLPVWLLVQEGRKVLF